MISKLPLSLGIKNIFIMFRHPAIMESDTAFFRAAFSTAFMLTELSFFSLFCWISDPSEQLSRDVHLCILIVLCGGYSYCQIFSCHFQLFLRAIWSVSLKKIAVSDFPLFFPFHFTG